MSTGPYTYAYAGGLPQDDEEDDVFGDAMRAQEEQSPASPSAMLAGSSSPYGMDSAVNQDVNLMDDSAFAEEELQNEEVNSRAMMSSAADELSRSGAHSASKAAPSGIEFQDIGIGAGIEDAELGAGGSEEDGDHADGSSLLGKGDRGNTSDALESETPEDVEAAAAAASVFSLTHYRSYFNVSSVDVKNRLLRALFPFHGPFFKPEDPNPYPDLYGPFWIATTLMFLMVATGDVAHTYFPGYKHFDMSKLTIASPVLYCNISVIPIIVWYALYRQRHNLRLIYVVSCYGYSLTPYVVACLVCVIPYDIVSWLAITVSCVVSTSLLVASFSDESVVTSQTAVGMTPDQREIRRNGVIIVLGFVTVLQLALALVFKLYFFTFEE